MTAILALAASSSSTGVMVLLDRDSEYCKVDQQLSCSMFPISIAFGLLAWFLLAITSHTVLWLLASLSSWFLFLNSTLILCKYINIHTLTSPFKHSNPFLLDFVVLFCHFASFGFLKTKSTTRSCYHFNLHGDNIDIVGWAYKSQTCNLTSALNIWLWQIYLKTHDIVKSW